MVTPEELERAEADVRYQAVLILQLEEKLRTAEAIALTMANKLEAIRGISNGWVDSADIDRILDSDDY